jgi:hypothetical protein
MSAGQGVHGWEDLEEEGWEMVSLTGDTSERPRMDGSGRGGAGSVRVRHLPIPEIPRPPRSKPIAIPKKLTARREGRPLSVTWDSQFEGEANILDPGTSGPRGFREEPIFMFPSVDRKIRGGQWLWPERTRSRRISHRQDQWLTPDEVRHRPRTPPRKPYTVPFSEKEDRKALDGVIGSGGRWDGMEAPFLHSFMPIPRIEMVHEPLETPIFQNSFMDDLPLDLSKMSL